MTYRAFWQPLAALHGEAEAKAIARMVMELRYGLTMTDVVCGAVDGLPQEQHNELAALQQRLLCGEPVQYVLGEAEFGGRRFCVGPGVLIPRPETYELCQWVVADGHRDDILDIGTGSGCIACTLAAELPSAHVVAWDISDHALRTAAENVRRLGVEVAVERHDILATVADASRWDAIVSNPPYVANAERADMSPSVKDFEPAEALFVPDDDPLLFYRAIVRYAATTLRRGGSLYLEINPHYADELERLLAKAGFVAIEMRRDQYNKQRMTKACRPTEK